MLVLVFGPLKLCIYVSFLILQVIEFLLPSTKHENKDNMNELTDKNGNFKQEYTVDGLHFSKSGYSKLTSIINRVLENK